MVWVRVRVAQLARGVETEGEHRAVLGQDEGVRRAAGHLQAALGRQARERMHGARLATGALRARLAAPG